MKRILIGLLAVLLSACAYREVGHPVSLLGDPAPVAAATRTVIIQPDTTWTHVTGGDTVKFVVGDKSFAWVFNVGASVDSFDLRRVAPPGVLDHQVIVGIAPDPRYLGGGGRRM
ncbi:MAG TPA: CzcE family metal-binding protein [Noviherbaspirillum sp.]|uniref:CzcE family metal-binding protein n=1 Tax=Noviherbaspirillum sp. TaxID=1926288 RepID=UPI002B46E51A|nr:CzcE family metal-binding protein [Noviherbaspirillum sp.]HJV84614.1 CzcE family metal-binding protein [Noviherbaspirillum sp.]